MLLKATGILSPFKDVRELAELSLEYKKIPSHVQGSINHNVVSFQDTDNLLNCLYYHEKSLENINFHYK